MSEQNSKKSYLNCLWVDLLGAGRFSPAEATAKNAARGRAKRVNGSETSPWKGLPAKAPPVAVVYIVVSTRTILLFLFFSGVKIE